MSSRSHDGVEMGENLDEHLRRDASVDRCSIVVCDTDGTNVGFVLGYRIERSSTVLLAKEVVVVPILGDPQQAPLLNSVGGKVTEDEPIFVGKETFTWSLSD